MADIDFDELDKAVNDLMANVDASKRPAGLDEPEEKVVTIPSSDTSPVAPSPTSPATVNSSPASVSAPIEANQATEVIPTPAPTAAQASASQSLAVRRRGQFMDIVHPSRDMNAAKPVSRQGATIQPGNDVIAPTTTQQPQPAAVETTNEQPKPEEVSPQSAASMWPDPIDMANSSPAPEAAAAPQVPVEPNTEETPLVSPFLPDAKPEKRPLGNLLQTEDVTQDAAEAAKDELQTPAVPEPAPAAVLPEELSGDLMAVESRDLSSHPMQPVTAPVPTEQPKLESTEELLIPAVATPDPVERQPQTPAVAPMQPPAGGSIAQQYTEQPSSGDQSNGSIYDTATYHQPIEPVAPVKKKTPTSVWIMVGIGLLLLGAIAGAAYFYFTR